jgi:hypothetical protein
LRKQKVVAQQEGNSMAKGNRAARALKKVAKRSRKLVDDYEAGDQTLGRKVDQLDGIVGALLDGFAEVAVVVAELEERDRARQTLSGGVDRTVRDVKAQFQQVQERIWAEDKGVSAVRRNVRAELDALWSTLEVVAQVVDGSDNVTVRDYYKR